MGFSTEQIASLSAKLNPAHVKQRKQGGFGVSYIEGWHAIAEANRIFGFDGWSSEVIELKCVREPQQVGDNTRVGYLAKVRITVGTVVREGIGYGSGISKDPGDAHESAIKEAETDARKRALMTFGNPFGLALYDKTRENVGVDDLTPIPLPSTERKSSASLKKNGTWGQSIIALRAAADLGEDAVRELGRSMAGEVQTWPEAWREQWAERIELAIDKARRVSA